MIGSEGEVLGLILFLAFYGLILIIGIPIVIYDKIKNFKTK